MRPWLFTWALRVRGDGAKIRAGSYQFAAPITLATLLDRLTRGDVTMRDLTFVEGWTFRQYRAAMGKAGELQPDSAALSDQEILKRIGASETHPEGLFSPDTYAFVAGRQRPGHPQASLPAAEATPGRSLGCSPRGSRTRTPTKCS